MELFYKFQHIKYSDQKHLYFIGGKRLLSITQFLKRIFPEFNSDFWSMYKAIQKTGIAVKPHFTKDGMSTEIIYCDGVPYSVDSLKEIYSDEIKEMLIDWKQKSNIGTLRVTYVHNQLEQHEKGLLDLIPRPCLDNVEGFNKSIELCDTLIIEYLTTNTHLKPIALEFKVGDEELGLAGTFDRLYFNEISNQLEIHDFKTDKDIKTKSKYGKVKMFDVDDCEFNKYSLQTSLYKFIIEKNTNLKLGDSYVTHFNLKEGKLEYYKCIDFTEQIKQHSNEQYWSTYIKC